MAATVLGKRQRSAIETEGRHICSIIENLLFSFHSLTLSHPVLPLRTPSKRRTRAPRILEEVGNPTISSTRQLRSRTRDCSPQQENDPSVKASTAGNGRSKHTVCDEKALSPTKTKSHVLTTKTTTGKSCYPPLEMDRTVTDPDDRREPQNYRVQDSSVC